ncbi:tyrosine kinase receptor Cad96Ca [Eupeodes corollae]|uniref:tyrosine kinase receptor Cad96Ca n=1 Tax=Eupeodes corollae TaxID=290404 RepID=UPI002492B9BF|nr:tyrosine kinase receptor Cad96Ca [Eupeodes corollae]
MDTKTANRTKWNLFGITIAAMVFAAVVKPATSQNSLLNTPPVMYVDRNWRISETEEVGSVIARVRADDAEHDLLQFDLEPNFHDNYANPSQPGTTVSDGLPFRIDPHTGVVYLNESLAGRGGQNFFLYITVSDGQLTAKNEVYVNIYARNDNKIYSSHPPSISQAARNISQFLPPFHMLPGVQSFRDQTGVRFPSNNLPPGFGGNNIYQTGPQYPGTNVNHHHQQQQQQHGNQQGPTTTVSKESDDEGPESVPDSTPPSSHTDSSTTRTKLTPVGSGSNSKTNSSHGSTDDGQSSASPSASSKKDAPKNGQNDRNSEHDDYDGLLVSTSSSASNAIKAIIPLVITVCGMFVAAGLIVVFIYRKRLCAISKTLKKKSKAEMAKKSNQSNLSSNLTDDSRNSMVLQHWNGPTAFGNRYVPWERDQQQLQQMGMATSQLSTSATGGVAGGAGGCSPNDIGTGSGGPGNVGGVAGAGVTGKDGSAGDRWEFPRHRLKFFNILGEGAFGQVWRCEATDIDGSVIARVRADDAEHDLLQFDLEPNFHDNYANPSQPGTTVSDGLPFRIDPHTGVVYLNESLAGRGGQNFFLYITVSDGQLTAKNEVYVNIYARNDNKIYSSHPPSISQAARNISQFLPPFHMLPGVQSFREQTGVRFPSNNLPPGFGGNNIYQTGPQYPGTNVNHHHQQQQQQHGNQQGPTTTVSKESDDEGPESVPDSTPPSSHTDSSTTRTKLTPVGSGSNSKTNSSHGSTDDGQSSASPSASSKKDAPKNGQNDRNSEHDDYDGLLVSTSSSASNAIKAIIPLVITVCGMFVAAGLIVVFIYRKRLCAISKTLKKKSKAEMAKKSNQSNLSSNLTDDSRNSMVLQHWNGPTAFGNRYVPWERDQQQLQQMGMATSQLSTSATGGVAGGAGGCSPNDIGTGSGGPGNVGGVAGAGVTGKDGSAGDRWEFPRHRLKFFNILGEGAFGQVWRCEATDIDGNDGVTTVAVKTLKENAAEIEKHDLVSELHVMKSLEPHINVVRLLGCCTDKDPIFVIIEYVNRGKLQTYLRNSRAERHYGNTHGKSNILTSGDLTSFMYQVAKGMDYLTSRGIIHRDLAARNILITDDNTCKVADFGFARDIVTSKVYERKSEGKLPIRWMAIESLYDNIFSVKSDIWSFGILMWEIVTLGSTPYPGISAADVMRKVRDGYRLEKPEHCRRELYNIMYYCWAQDAIERPTFSEIVQMLDKLLHTEMDYIELERFPDHNYYNILNLSGEKL